VLELPEEAEEVDLIRRLPNLRNFQMLESRFPEKEIAKTPSSTSLAGFEVLKKDAFVRLKKRLKRKTMTLRCEQEDRQKPQTSYHPSWKELGKALENKVRN